MNKHDLVYDNYKQYEIDIEFMKECDKDFLYFGDSFSHRFKFDNDYGASVIKHYGSYGYAEDLFELAVLFFDDKGQGHLTYNTPITNDVVGYLTNDKVLELLEQIKNL